MTRRPEKQLAALQAELDPDGSHGTGRIWAALKSTGIEPEDIVASFTESGPGLHPKVPKERTDGLLQQRREIREGLRRSRIEQVREALEALGPDDVRRFERTAVQHPRGGGVRALCADDLPPVDAIDGVSEFKAQQQRQMERVQKDQERKANAICTDFLVGKKRAEDADAKVAALNKRLKEYKDAEAAKWKAKKIEAQKAEDRRQQNVAKAAKDRAEYEDELQEKLENQLNGARQRRAHHYSKENLSTKVEAARAKREAAFEASVEQEERTLAEMQRRQQETEERLYRRNMEVAERLEMQRQKAQDMFLHKQAMVEAAKQEWAENKLKDHNKFMDRFKDARKAGLDGLKQKSKSCGDISKKARDKWRSNYDRLQNDKGERNDEIMQKHANATHRVEFEHKPMKYKCGADVFSHLESKEKTFGDLQQRRWAEIKKAQDARTMAACIRVAERDAKDAAKKAAEAEVMKKRVEAKKEILRYSNEASAVFLKIKCEPNEAKIRSAMQGLGFKMPRVGGDDDEEAAAS